MSLARACDICGDNMFSWYWDVMIQRKDAELSPDQDATSLTLDLCWSCLTKKLKTSTELEDLKGPLDD